MYMEIYESINRPPKILLVRIIYGYMKLKYMSITIIVHRIDKNHSANDVYYVCFEHI